MTIKYGKTITWGVTFLLGTTSLAHSQYKGPVFGLEYAAEVENNFKNKFNWVNLWTLGYEQELWRNGFARAETVSTYKTSARRIADDLQTFSNIEEDNLYANIFLAGYTHRFNNVALFGGIRNVNEDYFTSEYTSLFTNSECGIYTPLAEDFPVANYPFSAVCLHLEYEPAEGILIKNSLYNGVAGKVYGGKESCFNIRPRKDGVMNLTEINFNTKSERHGLYNIGCAVHSGYKRDNEDNGGRKKRTPLNCFLWAGAEQAFYKSGDTEAGLLLQFGAAPKSSNICRWYYGAGIIMKGLLPDGRGKLGITANRAIFNGISENALEVTWQYELAGFLTVQPAYHHTKTGNTRYNITLLRFIISL